MEQPKFCIFGAAPDTRNLGVSALCAGALHGIYRSAPQARATVFDHGRSLRRDEITVDGEPRAFERLGAIMSRRLYRPESLWRIRRACRTGNLRNPAAQAILQATAVFDITAGDSFTDLYGQRGFESGMIRKLIALEAGRPLILLPQTYGPFSSKENAEAARDVILRSAMAWARDSRSFGLLKELLGKDFDPKRHHEGVDLAFGLQLEDPGDPEAQVIREWIESGKESGPVIGFNISGLILNQPEKSHTQYGFKADYRESLKRFFERFLRETNGRVLLTPHVVVEDLPESDPAASRSFVEDLDPVLRERCRILPSKYSHQQIRWFISQLDWFCGTRMHSTIAALTAETATATICYSDKAQGVFDGCGVGNFVIDPRVIDTDEVVESLWRTFSDRDVALAAISKELPRIQKRARQQMEQIMSHLLGSDSDPRLPEGS